MAMASVSILNPSSEEAENRKREAQKHWNVLRKAGDLVRVNSMKIGYHAYALKKDNLFGILGFDNEKKAQVSSGVGESTWFATIRLAEQFSGVSEELFCSMRQANAKALADLPESKRLSEYWIRMAATDSMADFAEKVEKELHGKVAPSSSKEPTVSKVLKMSKSQRTAVETGLLDYSKSVGCDGNETKALELMVAEHSGGTSLIGSITDAVGKLAEAKQLGDSGLSADEALEKVYAIIDEVVEGFRGALHSAQNLEGEE